MVEPRLQGRPFALILLMKKHAHVFFLEGLQILPGAVGGVVIDNDQFFLEVDLLDALDNLPDRLDLIVDRHDNG